MFLTLIVLVLDPAPFFMSTQLGEILSRAARNLRHSSFALPSTGGAAILNFRIPSTLPATSLLRAPGRTLILKITPPSFAVILRMPEETISLSQPCRCAYAQEFGGPSGLESNRAASARGCSKKAYHKVNNDYRYHRRQVEHPDQENAAQRPEQWLRYSVDEAEQGVPVTDAEHGQ